MRLSLAPMINPSSWTMGQRLAEVRYAACKLTEPGLNPSVSESTVLLFLSAHHEVCGPLVPQPGIDPMPPASDRLTPNSAPRTPLPGGR